MGKKCCAPIRSRRARLYEKIKSGRLSFDVPHAFPIIVEKLDGLVRFVSSDVSRAKLNSMSATRRRFTLDDSSERNSRRHLLRNML